MTFWIIGFVILGTAGVVLALSMAVVSGRANRAIAESRRLANEKRPLVPGHKRREAKMRPYFDDEMDFSREDER